MDSGRVDVFMQEYGKYFPAEKAMYVKEKISSLDDSKSYLLDTIKLKNPVTYFIIGLILPGVEKMMLGNIGLGCLKLFTAGGIGIWWFIDLFRIMKNVRELNFAKLMSVL